MKRDLALLLTAVSLTFALTACGGDDDVPNPAPDTGNTMTDGSTAPGDNNSTLGDDVRNGVNDVEQGVDDVIDDVTDPMLGDNSAGTGNSAVTQSNRDGGVSYGEMLRNGRVHDTDGDLTDFENSVTQRRSY